MTSIYTLQVVFSHCQGALNTIEQVKLFASEVYMLRLLSLFFVLGLSLGVHSEENKYNTWAKYYDQYRDHLQEFIHLTPGDISDMRPVFDKGFFYIYHPGFDNTYRTIVMSTPGEFRILADFNPYSESVLDWIDNVSVGKWVDGIPNFNNGERVFLDESATLSDYLNLGGTDSGNFCDPELGGGPCSSQEIPGTGSTTTERV